MTDKELRILDEMLTNLGIWSTWNKTFANEMIGICSKRRNLLANRKTENSSEKPNNCEHITEDGVTCAKYPACDDCIDNPLNKVKGSERLVKGSEQTEPTMRLHEWTSDDITFCTAKCEVKCFRKPKYIKHKDIPHSFSDFSNSCVEYEPKDEPQTCSVDGRPYDCGNCEPFKCTADEPQTERSSE